ncbi:diacylglycerol kinase [Ferroacidibacillus organovorans]|uniref:Lipid kinase n=1 Tax=Ferroacidibacillus organovorans TaxID=1765683 RepID=A0A101XS10_9BACL|nr:diacylglycerol kinase [Ferroacidibacillus organovorans]KUO96474.1 lipid kinase [Ferroacidibacillus organovorans]
MRPRIRLIYNPTAGKEAFRQHLPQILQILESAGYEASCHATAGPGDATKEAFRAANDGFQVVVACGGDGTVNEVVNGLAASKTRPILGIIPSGTANDLARALEIPRNVEEAARRIAQGQIRSLDLGCVGEDRYFVNIAAFGRLTEITYEVPSKMKTMLGHLAYYMKGLERLPGLRAIEMKITSDTEQFEGPAMLCLVTNSRAVGGFERVAPRASVSDGWLDVLIVKQSNLGDLIRLVSTALMGDHTQDERVVYFHAKRIELSSQEEVDLNIDGEYGGRLPHKVTIKEGHLQVISG